MSLHFLIDGYNLIKRSSTLAQKSLEDGRQSLIGFVETKRPQGSERNRVTIVFDGKPGMYGLPTTTTASVIFTEYESADDRIKAIVEDAANKKEIVVVTDDKDLYLYVRKLGANVMSNAEFVGKAGHASGKSGPKTAEKAKIISSVFEYKINQEFEKIWLDKKKPKE
jgi:predicted RNA-binding protein with PIN domain